jgi:hypothetical protein
LTTVSRKISTNCSAVVSLRQGARCTILDSLRKATATNITTKNKHKIYRRLTLQLSVVLVVHELVGVAPPADEAVLVAALHVLVQLVTVVEALPARHKAESRKEKAAWRVSNLNSSSMWPSRGLCGSSPS